MNMSTQMEHIERRFAQERVFAQAYSLVRRPGAAGRGGRPVWLMSYSVARRVNEIGVRMALGAQRLDVVRMIMRESTLLVAAGVVIGIAAALAQWAAGGGVALRRCGRPMQPRSGWP